MLFSLSEIPRDRRGERYTALLGERSVERSPDSPPLSLSPLEMETERPIDLSV